MESRRTFLNAPVARVLALVVAVVLVLGSGTGVGPSTCSAQGTCPQPAAYGRQPYVTELVPVFDQAGTNRLGSNGPTLPQMWSGYPPSQAKQIAPYVPCILLKAIGYTETSGWKQFNASYGQSGYTRISPDCGYGIMQVTSGMDGNGGFDPYRVTAEPAYNIGAGAKLLMGKWNALNYYVGANNPHTVEDWYYAVWAYNGWGWYNNPNHPRFLASRGVWECGVNLQQNRGHWPYQELIWGCAANPPGNEYWEPVSLTLPNRASLNFDPPPAHIDTPQPSHGSCEVIHLPLVLNNYPACSYPITNGNFENSWSGWEIVGGTLIAGSRPYTGNYSAWFGGENGARDILYQTISIPATGSTGAPIVSATLSYFWQMTTEESWHPYDYLYVKLKNAYNGTDLVTLETVSDGSVAGVWSQSTFGISSYIGQDVQVHFSATTDNSYPTSFYLDDVVVRACEGW